MPERAAGPGEILARVAACAVCRTDLHVVDGELTQPKLPLIPGHEIVARVVACGPGVEGFAVGSRIGIPWLGWSCGVCPQCRTGRENLCPEARFTGYQITAAMPTMSSPMRASASLCPTPTTTCMPHRCCAPG